MGIADYSTTAADNTSISGIAVSDSTVPSNLDNIVRQLMADTKTYFPAGGFVSGSWTPTLMFNGTSTGITYATQIGRYRKIGDLVTLFANITLTSNGSASGSAQISGLPFNVVTDAGYATVGDFGHWLNISNDSLGFHTYLESADTRIDLLRWNGAGTDTGQSFLTEADIDDDASFTISIQYIAA